MRTNRLLARVRTRIRHAMLSAAISVAAVTAAALVDADESLFSNRSV